MIRKADLVFAFLLGLILGMAICWSGVVVVLGGSGGTGFGVALSVDDIRRAVEALRDTANQMEQEANVIDGFETVFKEETKSP